MPSGLTYKKVGELCRFRVGASRAERLRFQALVNDALQKVSDKVAVDMNRRQQMLTDRTSVTGTLTLITLSFSCSCGCACPLNPRI